MTETIDQALRAWAVAQDAAGCCAETIRQRHAVVTRAGAWLDTDPRCLTAEQVQAWLTRPARDGGPLAPASRAAYYRALRAWHGWLTLTERIDRDPTLRLARPRVPRGVPRGVTTDELRELVGDAIGDLRAWLLLAAYQGLRAGEVARVRGEDVRPGADGGLLDVLGKGGVRESIPLHPVVAELAASYPRVGWWFPSPSPFADVHIRSTTVSRRVGQHFRRHDLAGATHRLRHWTGTTTLRATGDLEVTRRVLRHASVATTQAYAATTDDRVRSAVSGLPTVA